jgi:hypothetical protein
MNLGVNNKDRGKDIINGRKKHFDLRVEVEYSSFQ